MKRFVVLTSEKLIQELVKSKIHETKNFKVIGKTEGYIEFATKKEKIGVSFKKINPNRPADLSRYPDGAIFTFINFYKSREISKLKELKNNLKKDITIHIISSINEFVYFLENQEMNIYYMREPECITYRTIYSYIEPSKYKELELFRGVKIFNNKKDAEADCRKSIKRNIEKLEKEINEKQNLLEGLKNILKNSK